MILGLIIGAVAMCALFVFGLVIYTALKGKSITSWLSGGWLP